MSAANESKEQRYGEECVGIDRRAQGGVRPRIVDETAELMATPRSGRRILHAEWQGPPPRANSPTGRTLTHQQLVGIPVVPRTAAAGSGQTDPSARAAKKNSIFPIDPNT